MNEKKTLEKKTTTNRTQVTFSIVNLVVVNKQLLFSLEQNKKNIYKVQKKN